jgi:hypothetical protein
MYFCNKFSQILNLFYFNHKVFIELAKLDQTGFPCFYENRLASHRFCEPALM